jgi:hypothetical protein
MSRLVIREEQFEARDGRLVSIWITYMNGRVVMVELAIHLPHRVALEKFDLKKKGVQK